MSIRCFPTHHSTPDSQRLAAKLSALYPLERPIQCRLFRATGSDIYQVISPTDVYYLKIYPHRYRTRTEIQEEVDLLNHLVRRGVRVAAPVQRRDGSYLHAISAAEGRRYGVLSTRACGKSIHDADVSAKQSQAFGSLAGRMHNCMDTVVKDYRRDHADVARLLDDALASAEPFLAGRRADLDYLAKTSEALKAQIFELLTDTKPQYGLCHGDLHTGNAHFGSDGEWTLLDFEDCGYGWRAHDIAFFLSRTGRGWSNSAKAGRTRRWNAFVRGYCEHRQLTRNELRAAELFVPIRQITGLGFILRHRTRYQGCHWITQERLGQSVAFVRDWVKQFKLL